MKLAEYGCRPLIDNIYRLFYLDMDGFSNVKHYCQPYYGILWIIIISVSSFHIRSSWMFWKAFKSWDVIVLLSSRGQVQMTKHWWGSWSPAVKLTWWMFVLISAGCLQLLCIKWFRYAYAYSCLITVSFCHKLKSCDLICC